MPKVKKIPRRQCVGCREMKDKKALLRVVKSPEGEVSLDFKGKKPGRGAYVCPDPSCLKRARKAKALERALSVTIPPDVFDAMEAEIRAAAENPDASSDKSAKRPDASRGKGDGHGSP